MWEKNFIIPQPMYIVYKGHFDTHSSKYRIYIEKRTWSEFP